MYKDQLCFWAYAIANFHHCIPTSTKRKIHTSASYKMPPQWQNLKQNKQENWIGMAWLIYINIHDKQQQTLNEAKACDLIGLQKLYIYIYM